MSLATVCGHGYFRVRSSDDLADVLAHLVSALEARAKLVSAPGAATAALRWADRVHALLIQVREWQREDTDRRVLRSEVLGEKSGNHLDAPAPTG